MSGRETMRPGDLVRVRSAGEILATLDEDGAVGGIPFMPEMIRHVDRRFRVSKRVEKICWYTPESSSRRLPDTVLLEELRCDGAAHGGCQAECRIYWKEAWLERVDDKTPVHASDEQALEELRDYVSSRTRITRTFENGPEEVFRCQITESVRASTPLPVRDWGSTSPRFEAGTSGFSGSVASLSG